MNKENTEKLLKEFPDLYSNYYKPMTETCMCWGFSCGDGWYNIIYNLSKQIVKTKIPIKAEQVKEKYGTLRFYIQPFNEEIEDLINKAEALSAITCEECGKEGKLTGKSWVKTLCNDCVKLK